MKTKILNLLYAIFLLSLAIKFITDFIYPYGYDSWGISEFLVNYQGGFVRRGLLGEGLFFLTRHFHFDLEWAIKIACTALYGGIMFFFVKSFLKKGYTLYILPLSFFLGIPVISYDWIRKDMLMAVFFILILLLYNKKEWRFAVRLSLINLLAILIILTHEAFAFFALPALAVLLLEHFKDKGFRASILYTGVSLLPCLLALGFAFSAHGSQEMAFSIWDSWKPYLPSIEKTSVGHSVNAIGWDSVQTMKFHLRVNFLTHVSHVWSLLGWGLLFPATYYILTNAIAVFKKSPDSYTEKHRTVLSMLLLFQLVCLSPLFTFLSVDYYRLFFYWTTSSFAIFLIIPMRRLENLFPLFITEHINRFFDRLLPPNKAVITLLMLCIGIPVGPFNTEILFHNSMIYNVLSTLTEPIILLEKWGFIDVYW